MMKNIQQITITPLQDDAVLDISGCHFTVMITDELLHPYEDINRKKAIKPYLKDYHFSPEQWLNEQESLSALYVAKLGDKTIGYACASLCWNGMAQLDELAIDEPYRGKGIAKQLLEKIEAWAIDNGLTHIRLESQSTNTTAAKFYYKHGFRIHGYDKSLYLCTENAHEVALFWYKTL
ncbi:GNAT family N-acetyltransferase [Providencia stuartii]|uniref:GNAT family N-acetyltransferase n=3 Tax=Providencia TaxID=586 RepID=A0AAI9MXT5_PROST|nr:GNAT family N-acetyltransferase [Providencia stuartii]ELR5044747.1 GNAT family N-acetyltransferase [Providencia rettgeri]MTB40153.1 GNAT family N-acetyltransferase [Providencia sp. wls1949]MTC07477.1 GNAT family N-acetyltransferase [Providencia sp. wls1948]QIC17870.1 GNAT family N-acetyltransferase [Providencia vermicola]